MNRKQLNAYYDRKKNNLHKAIKFLNHVYNPHPLNNLTIIVKCSEKEHSEYCVKLGCSGYYNKRSGEGQLLNFYEYK